MEIKVEPKKIAIGFLCVVAVLTVISSVLLFFYYYLDDDDLFGLIDMFDFAIENNIPTFYSAVAILFCSVLLALITYVNWHRLGGKRFYWLWLTVLFLFLAIDEAVAIHEAVGSYFERYIRAEGLIYYAWVIPYGIAVVVIGLVFLRFVRELPRNTRTRFVAAGVIYLIGVLGIEMLGAREADLHNTETVLYSMLYMLEEILEMLGIVLFIYALLSHLTEEMGRLSIVLELADDDPSRAMADDDVRKRQP